MVEWLQLSIILELREIAEDDEDIEGVNEDPTHCELAGLPQPDTFLAETIGDMIAQCVSEIHPTRLSGQQ